MSVVWAHRNLTSCSTGRRTFYMFLILCTLIFLVHYPQEKDTQKEVAQQEVPLEVDFQLEDLQEENPQTEDTQTEDPQAGVYHCYMDIVPDHPEAEKADSQVLQNVLHAKEKPVPGKTIFFFETKCNCKNTAKNILSFTAHEACSIESAALHHPNYEVFVLFACPTMRQRNHPIIDAILSYKNVKLRYVNLWQFSMGTPIEDWMRGYSLFHSQYLIFTLSDLFRLLALYNYGGIYLDMDVVVMRSFENTPPNFMGAETTLSIGNSVIGFEPTGSGHKVLGQLLTDFYQNYNGDIWAHNGPMSLMRVMSKVCGTDNVLLMVNKPARCHGIQVYSTNAFYEINWLERDHYFNRKYARRTMKRLKTSYLTHMWNHVETNWPFKTNSKSAYMRLTAKHCPRVFKATGKYFT